MAVANKMPGLLKVANDISGGARVDTGIGPLPSSGASQAFSTIAGELNGIGNKIGALADHAAAVEGAEAGRTAGLDPEFRPTRSLTIRGEAYDKAGLDVAETQWRQTIEADFDGTFQKLQANPAEFSNTIDAKTSAHLKQAPEEIRPTLQLLMQGKKLAYMRDISRQQAERVRAETTAALQTEIGESLKGVHQRAYSLGLDPKADEVLAGDLAMLSKALRRTDVTGKPLVDPGKAAGVLADAKQEITTSRLLGAFGRLPSLEAKAEFIKQFEDDFANSKGLAKEYDLPAFETVSGKLTSELRSARAEGSVLSRALTEDVNAVAKMAEKGFAPSDAELAGLKSRVVALGGTEKGAELFKDLQDAERIMAWQKSARTATPAELDAFALSERGRMAKDGADPLSVKRLELAETLTNTMRTELKQDALGWADRVGLLKVAPLDFTSPEAGTASMKGRIAQADEVAQQYGQAPQYLRPDEKRQMSVAAAQGGEQMLQVATVLAAASGDRTPKVIAEIADEAPLVALVAGHVAIAGTSPAARDAADGIALAKTDGFKSRAPSKDKANAAAAEVLGPVLANQPKDQSAAIAAANAIYEVRAARAGAATYDPELWKQGLKEILGQSELNGETYGGIAAQGWFGAHPVLLPPAMRQDALPDVLSQITPGTLVEAGLKQPVGEHGRQLPMSAIRGGTLVMIKPGQYAVATGDPSKPGEERWLKATGGDPFVLDFNALAPILRKRRPELWKGSGG